MGRPEEGRAERCPGPIAASQPHQADQVGELLADQSLQPAPELLLGGIARPVLQHGLLVDCL
jgi:hypothetical protein